MRDNQLLKDLFRAYYDARKNKRSTINALRFEIDYESKLFQLYEEIKNRKYELSRSICFISFYPVMREVFAADFRDRIVHHLIYNYINPVFERLFIHDSYSCRKGKGTSYGIKRLDHFIRSCSCNYKKDCYILKLDIKGYFMSMDRYILYQKIENTLNPVKSRKAGAAKPLFNRVNPVKSRKAGAAKPLFNRVNRFKDALNFDLDLIFYLIRKVVFHDSTKNCEIRGKRSNWQGLPKSKSLFWTRENKGFPIGNLTSQLFGNIYLDDFDHFVKYRLGCKYYGRYVDDFVILHPSREYLKSIIPLLDEHLKNHLFLELHPKKIYLQHFSKGIDFLGVIIKPYRIYIKNRVKGNFYKQIFYWNKLIKEKGYKLEKEDLKKFLASMNSYLGMMRHYNTYRLRKKMLEENLSKAFWNYFYPVRKFHFLKLR